nr:hypothetical protein [Tanacetum cinerariifolium]
ANQAPSAEETEPFETDESAATPPPHPAYRMTARISIPAPVPMPAWTDSEIVRLLAISSPPALPLFPWSSPPPQIPFLPLPPILSPPSPVLSPAPPPSPIPCDALRSTNGDDSHNSGTVVRRTERANRECTYTNFLKCQPLPFKGTEGVASLSQWCERMESTVGHEAAYGMSWKTLMKMMTEKYCPLNEIRKLEMELWDLKIEKYVGGLPDMIHGSVVASKPKTMQEAIEIATELMDKKIRTFPERETASKRKFENTSRNTQNQQQQHSNKRRNTGRVYTVASGEKKQYGDTNPYALNAIITTTVHVLLSAATATKLAILHVTVGVRQNTNNANNQRGTGLGQRPACYECGVQRHFKRECPKLKNNNNHGNQGGRN